MDKLFLRNLFLSTRVLQGLEFMINGCLPRSRKMVKKHREIGSPPLIQALVAKRAFIVIPNHPSSVSIAWSRADLSCEPGFCRSVLSLALLHHILHHSTIDPSVALCTTSGPYTTRFTFESGDLFEGHFTLDSSKSTLYILHITIHPTTPLL